MSIRKVVSRWQPGFPPQSQPGYQYQGVPGPAGYAPAPVAASPRNNAKLLLIALIAVLVVGGGVSAFFLIPKSSTPSTTAFDRHGVPANVPLPEKLTFGQQYRGSKTDPTLNVSYKGDEWGWQVGSPNDSATVQRFYQQKLPGNGWTDLKQQQGDNGDQQLTACQGDQVLGIETGASFKLTDLDNKKIGTVTAPPGGSALGIVILTTQSQELLQLICNNQTPMPTSGANAITLGSNTLSTDAMSIAQGDSITFVDDPNTGAEYILVIGTNGSAEDEAGAPNFGGASGHPMQPGDTWTTPPWNTPGTYHVTCEVHPTTMNLTVTVTG